MAGGQTDEGKTILTLACCCQGDISLWSRFEPRQETALNREIRELDDLPVQDFVILRSSLNALAQELQQRSAQVLAGFYLVLLKLGATVVIVGDCWADILDGIVWNFGVVLLITPRLS